MICKSCGAENAEGAAFCAVCGASLAEKNEVVAAQRLQPKLLQPKCLQPKLLQPKCLQSKCL